MGSQTEETMGKGRRYSGILLAAVAALVGLASTDPVRGAETYPSKAIDIIVPWGPGGATDTSARITADFLKKKWGVPINVVNKPGGNTVPASLEVYNAAPDGYTVMGESAGGTSILTLAVKNLPFKVMDRTFLGIMFVSPNLLVVNAKGPYKTLKDLVDDIRKDPAGLVWSSLGGASTPDIAVRQLVNAVGIDFARTKPVTASSTSHQVVLVAGGHTKLSFSTVTTSLPLIKSGMVKGLGVTGLKRHSEIPDVPTFAELGFSTVSVINWAGMTGPPKMPAHVIAIWEKAIQEMVKDPEIIAKLKNVGLEPFYFTSNDSKDRVAREIEEFAKLK